jgi:hypothetical protein
MKTSTTKLHELYFLKIKNQWNFFRHQHFSFWMICCYLFFEYSRPQAIFPAIDFLPWAQLFLIGSLIGAFLDRSVSWVSHPINFWLIFFAIVVYISSIYANYPQISSRYYVDFYSWFIVYFLSICIVNTPCRFYLFLMIFILSAAKIAIGTSLVWASRGFAFTSWGLMGPQGYFQNSGELAILMLTLFPVAFYLCMYLKDRVSKFEKILLYIFWIAPTLTIIGASSRGSQLALAAQMLIMFRKYIFRIKTFIPIIGLIALLYNILPEEQKARFQTLGEDETSRQRLLYWEHGLEMMKKYPVLGVGYFNFPRYYELHYPEDVLLEFAELPHNIFIQTGNDVGFTGLTAYVIMLLLALRIPLHVRKLDTEPIIKLASSGIAIGLFGFVIAGQFVSVVYYPFMWIGIAFLVITQNISRK